MANETENMVQFRTCLESELSSKAIIPGSIIICSDTGDMYHDTSDNERLRIARSISYFDTDADRVNCLIPESEVVYIVKSTGKIWIYSNSWVCLNSSSSISYFSINNVEIPTGVIGVTISDDRITESCIATFNPIPALYDLATASDVTTTCACSNGSITVITSCNYPLIGTLMIVKG